MTRPTNLGAFLFCLLFSINYSFSQTFQSKDNPIKMDLVKVEELAKALIPSCGFSSVYIQTSDIRDLMSVKNCVGIRFYIAMEDPKQRFSDVIAVAINADGKEIGDFLERKYHLARALDAHYPDEFEKMNLSTAKKCVYNLRDGVAGYKPYATFLGNESLNALLNTANATGIRIFSSGYESDKGQLRTMSFGAVVDQNNEIKDLGGKYLQSQLPCPVDCGGDTNLLWNR
ncbi:MAG: hypothetical protein GC178_13115 [Flavobacteriales bacterium]|nr:hypothetical protein [Flavobacteriales bacterium]